MGEASVELYWLPLGAGGWFVKLNGRLWEAVHALSEGRRPLDLYHTALQVRVPEGRYVIENCWPIPDADPAARGVAVEVNCQIVPRARHAEHVLADGDRLEIVTLVGGG